MLVWLFKGDIDRDPLKVTDIDVEVDVDIDRYFSGCLKVVSKSLQGIIAVMALTLIVLKWPALHYKLQGTQTDRVCV